MSRYIDHLPPILRQGTFIGPFVRAFERILTGVPGAPAQARAIEETLSAVATYFDPSLTPPEFLPWLAGWAAISLRDDWDLATRQKFVANIVSLYQMRGTRPGLEALLELHGLDFEIYDPDYDASPPFFGPGSPPHMFWVTAHLPGSDPLVLGQTVRLLEAVIERQKPAHTFYGLGVQFQAMQINDDPPVYPEFGPGIFLGVNTILGTDPPTFHTMEINDDPALYPQYGPGVLVGNSSNVGNAP